LLKLLYRYYYLRILTLSMHALTSINCSHLSIERCVHWSASCASTAWHTALLYDALRGDALAYTGACICYANTGGGGSSRVLPSVAAPARVHRTPAPSAVAAAARARSSSAAAARPPPPAAAAHQVHDIKMIPLERHFM
jgi:hypothetical protein